jgi:hypothetical protein
MKMKASFVDLKETRFQEASHFAEQFSQLEWHYLCSHRWFLTGVDEALGTGDFFPLRIRAEQTLVNDRIRLRCEPSKNLCHSKS